MKKELDTNKSHSISILIEESSSVRIDRAYIKKSFRPNNLRETLKISHHMRMLLNRNNKKENNSKD